MAGTDIFDIMLQFHQTAIQDLQVRILNASLSTNLWVKSPFSRVIEQPVPPLEIKARWNEPEVTVSNDSIELAADVSGGARQVATGRILTLDGRVSARQNVTFAVDTSERPYACAETPGPMQLSMRKLKVSYEGSRWPSFLATLNPAKEETLLRPVFTTQLFGPLACLPLTYMPYSFPIALPTKKSTAAETLPIVHVLPGVLKAPASVALGLMLDKRHPAPSTFTGVLPEKASYNAAISISTQGLNTLLAHLCHQGEAMGQWQHSRLGQIHWRWETLAVTLRQQVVHIAGALVQQGFRAQVQAEVRCQLDTRGCLQCTLLSSNTDAILAETLLASWTELLKTLFRSRAANKQDRDPHDRERLFQCFDLPGTTRTIETTAQELLVAADQFIIYYTLPKSLKEFQLELPPPKPAVTITQPHIPQQIASGAPVTIELEARITKDSSPPYDYAWTTDLSPEPSPEHGPGLTIHAVPLAPVVGSGPQELTTAHLKVVDMFGQVSETHAPAQYIPYTKQKRQQNSVQKGGGVGTVLVLIVAIVRLLTWTQAHHVSLPPLGGGGGNYTIQTTIGEETFTIAVNQGKACMTRDNNSVQDRNYICPGTAKPSILFKSVFQCSGTYQNSQLDFTETVTSDEIDSQLDASQNCTASSQHTYIHLVGTASGNSISGTYTWNFPSWNCGSAVGLQTGLDFYFQNHGLPLSLESGGQGSGSWTGQITSA